MFQSGGLPEFWQGKSPFSIFFGLVKNDSERWSKGLRDGNMNM